MLPDSFSWFRLQRVFKVFSIDNNRTILYRFYLMSRTKVPVLHIVTLFIVKLSQFMHIMHIYCITSVFLKTAFQENS